MAAGYLLDTNVVAELRKGERADPGVREWFDRHTDDALWLSVLVVAELRRGGELLRRRDVRAGDALLAWLETVTSAYADRILEVTTDVAERWVALDVHDPTVVIDGLLAATAIEHDLVLVTRRSAAVERTGVPVDNPFSVAPEAAAPVDAGERHEPTPGFEPDDRGDGSAEAAPPPDVPTPVGQTPEVLRRSRRPRPGTRGRLRG